MSDAVGPHLSTALSTALAHLKLGDFQSRWDIAKAIPELGKAAIAPLIELLQDEAEDWELTWFIAQILGNLKHPDAIDTLVNLIQTTANEEVAGMAAAALTQMGTEAIDPLQTLLTQASTYCLGVQALAQIPHPDIVPSLLEAMQHESPPLRVVAIEALSHFQHPQISAALLAALQDADAKVRQSAVTTLGLQANLHSKDKLTACLKPLLWDVNLDVCQQTAIALGRVGTSAVQALSEVLRSPHTPASVQIEAIRGLALIGSREALIRLQEFLLQSDSPICQEAITVLGRVEVAETKTQATQMLLELLYTDHPIAQIDRGKQAIALSLGQLQQPEALETLIQLLAEPSASVRLHAIAALKQLDALEQPEALEQPDTLKQSEPKAAEKRLRELAAQDGLLNEELRKGVAIALKEWSVQE